MRRLVLLGGILFASSVPADDAIPVVRLPDVVEVAHADVRWIDLSTRPLDAAFGRDVVLAAPAPGHERVWTRQQIRREAVRRGVAVVPDLAGSDAVRIVRRGGDVSPDVLARRVLALLREVDVPPGALDHSFEILRLPSVQLPEGPMALSLDGEVPRVGRGAVAIRLEGDDGTRRRFYAMVRRAVRVDVLRMERAVDARTVVTGASAVVDTVWTDDLALLDRRLDPIGLDGRHRLIRRVNGGRVLLENDVRATPVVERGELVHWVVERDGLRIEVRARARQDGAVGEWISVLSPFDQRQRRVVVIAPGTVADHPPAPSTRGES